MSAFTKTYCSFGFGLVLTMALSSPSFSQEAELLNFEKSIEKAVVAGDIPFLQTAYADDFRFKHGTGKVDSKTSWINYVEKAKGTYLSRVVDSVEVEIHNKIGITNGQITVHTKTDKVDRVYMIKYVRVYTKKDEQWQLIMHRTVFEKTISQ